MTRPSKALPATVALAAMLALALPGVASALPPGPRLAFLEVWYPPERSNPKAAAKIAPGTIKIVSTDAAGHGRKVMMRTPGVEPIIFGSLSWSADGERLAFRGRPAGANEGSKAAKIRAYVVDADGSGLHAVPGTIGTVAAVISPDGESVYIGGWNSRCIKKVRRDRPGEPQTATVQVDIMVDNLTWSPSGRILAAGTYGTNMKDFLAGHFGQNPRVGIPSRVISVDPDTLATEDLIDYGPDTFGAATTALQVGREIWVGTARDQGLARFRFPNART